MHPRRCSTPLFAWREALTDPDLGPQDVPSVVRRSSIIAVAVAGLSLHMTSKGEKCFPSVETIAKETGMGERTVQRALRALVAGGWLHVHFGGGRGKSNRYFIRMPSRARYVLEHADEFTDDIEALPGEKGANTTPFSRERVPTGPERVSTETVKGAKLAPEIFRRSSLDLHDSNRTPPPAVVSLDSFRARKSGEPEPGSPPAHQTAEPPTWTYVWAWARGLGETRCFPQVAPDLLYGDSVVLSMDDYRGLEAKWRAEGSPKQFNPRAWLAGKTVAQREEVPT